MKLTIDTDRMKLQISKLFGARQDFFPPTKSLLSLPIVIYTISCLFFVSLMMVIGIVSKAGELAWAFDEKGYILAADLFKAPISIVLLSIPLLALLASNHRSVQTMSQMRLTTQQIDLTNGQNLFANYYKHVDEFAKWCEHLSGLAQVQSRRKLHKKLFPHAQSGDFTIPSDSILEFQTFADNVKEVLLSAQGSGGVEEVARIRIVTLNFARSFWLKTPTYDSGEDSIPLQKGARLFLPKNGLQGFVQQHLDLIKAVDEIFSFDPTYHSSKLITSLSNLSLSTLPTEKSGRVWFHFPELNM